MDSHLLFPRHEGHDTGTGSSAATMDMGDGMDTGSSSSTHSGMAAVFQTSIATSLYSARWTPSNTGTYAATCIFLIVLAAIFRGLLALKAWQENRWLDKELQRRYVVVNGKAPLAENLSRDSLAKPMVLGANGIEENVMVVAKRTTHARPWRLSVDPVRAVIDTVIAGVAYLLWVFPLFHPLALGLAEANWCWQHVGGHDHERRLFPLSPRRHLSWEPARGKVRFDVGSLKMGGSEGQGGGPCYLFAGATWDLTVDWELRDWHRDWHGRYTMFLGNGSGLEVTGGMVYPMFSIDTNRIAFLPRLGGRVAQSLDPAP